MIAVVLGGAKGVWSDLSSLRGLIEPDLIVATNDAGVVYPGRLDAWVSLHPEKLPEWRRRRKGNQDYRCFTHKRRHGVGDVEQVVERWPGSSGLFAAHIALDEMGASGVVLCGVPMDRAAAHFFEPGAPWLDAENYRRGFQAALPVIGGSVRSMSGWTAELLGVPDAEWLTNRAAARSHERK